VRARGAAADAAMRGSCAPPRAAPCAHRRSRTAAARARAASSASASSAPPPPPPPPPQRPSSARRTAKNPADWGGDYDAIRSDLQRAGPPSLSLSSALNFIGERFGGSTPSGGPRRSAAAAGKSEGGLGEALLSGAYTLLSWMGATPLSSGREEGLPDWSDPAPIAVAARRARDAERAAAAAAWGGGARGGGEAGTQLAVTLACGCVRARCALRCAR
jgi:hypothetical protein